MQSIRCSDRHLNNNTWLHDSLSQSSALTDQIKHSPNTCAPDINTSRQRRSFWTAVISILLGSLWDIPPWFCTVFRFFPFASWSKAKAFDQDFQRIPLVLLASTLTGQWWSNDNYSTAPIWCPWIWHQQPVAPSGQEKGEILGQLKEERGEIEEERWRTHWQRSESIKRTSRKWDYFVECMF